MYVVVSNQEMPKYPTKEGRVKQTGQRILEKGEFVLPYGVKPTKAQIKAVQMKKCRMKKKNKKN
jgi:hypothetical protein